MSSANPTYPVFSLITPTFRRPYFLVRNIESVRSQTYNNYEHIIIDDGNDPITGRIVEGFNDQRIVLLKHDHPRGAAAAYNTGIRNSRGKFITFLDDDDEYSPEYLDKMNEHFKNAPEDIGFIWSGIEKINDIEADGRKHMINKVVWPSRFPDLESGLVAATSIGNGFGVCMRRDCIGKTGLYDETLVVGADTDFMFRLAMNYKFETVPEALVRIHQHGIDQLTGNSNNLERIRVKKIIMERYSVFLEKYPRVFCVHYHWYADLCYRSGLKNKGRKSILLMIRKHPFKSINYFDFFSYELTGKNTAGTYLGKVMRWIKLSILSG